MHTQGSAHTSRCIHKVVHTQGGAHKRRSVATAGVLLFKGPRARRYTYKAVYTQGGAPKRRPVATAGLLLFKGPQARRYTHKAVHTKRSVATAGVLLFKGPQARRYTQKAVHRRRRRRCGPPVGRPRGTSPWCPPALHGLARDREGGFIPTRPAKHHGGGSSLRLLPLSPGPHYVHAPPPYT